MKYAILILLGMLHFNAMAQKAGIKGSGYILTQERKTDLFHSIEVSDHISVYIVQGTFGSITVEADNNLFPYIKTEVKNNLLKVYIPDSIHIVKFTFMNILISLPEIRSLTAQQHSLINAAPQMWKSRDLTLFASSNSKIHLATEATTLRVDAKTAATIELKGSCQQLEATLNSAAKLFAKNLKAQNVSIVANNHSKAEIQVVRNLEYKVTEHSKLSYKGDPQITTDQLEPDSKIIHNR